MSITIQPSPNCWSLFTRNIGDKHIQQAINSSSKEEATHLDIFSKIKDWFCGTKTDEVLGLLYDLKHTPDNQSDIESSLQKAEAFYKLKEMSPPKHQDKFQVSIAKNEISDEYTFKSSIKGAMEEITFDYGSFDTENNIAFLKNKNANANYNKKLENFFTQKNYEYPNNEWIRDFVDSHKEILDKFRINENLAFDDTPTFEDEESDSDSLMDIDFNSKSKFEYEENIKKIDNILVDDPQK
ncbi:MAG TPA: hypothetical protein ACHBX0_00615 [Arsenophonus sp.]